MIVTHHSLYDIVGDRYKLIKLIGSGSNSTIYQAVHIHSNEDVAIKIIPIKQYGGNKVIARFLRETKFMQSLKDDTNDIIYFHGLYMIMEVKIVRNDNVYFTLISNDYDYDPDSKYNSVFSIKNIAMVIWIFKMMLNALQKN